MIFFAIFSHSTAEVGSETELITKLKVLELVYVYVYVYNRTARYGLVVSLYSIFVLPWIYPAC